ncbi:MAG: hypothetical protein J0H09_24215 [Burkholderiales bacterium]|nr:hypothetical protein [Burkholderiales bacterium]
MRKMHTLRSSVAMAACLLSASVFAQGNLENPVAGSIESGVGLISGWHCTAKEIRVFVDGVDIGKSGVGSSRNDTASTCGHANTGYSVLFNYNLLTPGSHTLSVYGDGALLETRQFESIRSAGVPFLEGASRDVVVSSFPAPGVKTRLRWSQAKQSFVVVGSEAENQMPHTLVASGNVGENSSAHPPPMRLIRNQQEWAEILPRFAGTVPAGYATPDFSQLSLLYVEGYPTRDPGTYVRLQSFRSTIDGAQHDVEVEYCGVEEFSGAMYIPFALYTLPPLTGEARFTLHTREGSSQQPCLTSP